MDQNLFENIGTQHVAVGPVHTAQRTVARAGQQRLTCLGGDGIALHQILHNGPGAAASSSSPMELMTCISSVLRSARTRVMRMYPLPPRRDSTM